MLVDATEGVVEHSSRLQPNCSQFMYFSLVHHNLGGILVTD